MNKSVVDLVVYAGIGAALLWFGAPNWSLVIPAVAATSVIVRATRRRT